MTNLNPSPPAPRRLVVSKQNPQVKVSPGALVYTKSRIPAKSHEPVPNSGNPLPKSKKITRRPFSCARAGREKASYLYVRRVYHSRWSGTEWRSIDQRCILLPYGVERFACFSTNHPNTPRYDISALNPVGYSAHSVSLDARSSLL